ncbi:MAG: hypothetical protein IPQ07_22880 [Myxococcales bacterium]|nr:hypothetical protein [Myxococcales bacterium]
MDDIIDAELRRDVEYSLADDVQPRRPCEDRRSLDDESRCAIHVDLDLARRRRDGCFRLRWGAPRRTGAIVIEPDPGSRAGASVQDEC